MVVADSAEIMRLMRLKQLGTYELARRAGISATTLLRVMEQRVPTQIMTIFRLAEALGVHHEDLIIDLTAKK